MPHILCLELISGAPPSLRLAQPLQSILYLRVQEHYEEIVARPWGLHPWLAREPEIAENGAATCARGWSVCGAAGELGDSRYLRLLPTRYLAMA
jgi:hypothetical protein